MAVGWIIIESRDKIESVHLMPLGIAINILGGHWNVFLLTNEPLDLGKYIVMGIEGHKLISIHVFLLYPI